jgi:hypothetical protein
VTIVLLLAPAPAAAQQGSVQVTAATVASTGDPSRTGLTQGFQPDFGILWFQPTTNWGTVNFDAHAVRGAKDPRLGRVLFAVNDLRRAGLKWNVSGGDGIYTPFLTGYGFNNLFAPQVTFRGGAVSASGPAASFTVTAGRVTVFRDLFAANADVLGQSLFVAQGSYRPAGRVEIVAHASRVRTDDLKEFSYVIQSSNDGGAGVRVKLTDSLQVIADAAATSYLRKGATAWEQQPSWLIGTRWTAPRGWFQLDAHRLSPGTFTVLNNPYNDREGVFAGGEYQVLKPLRLFGEWDVFRNDTRAVPVTVGDTSPSATASRAFGGARVQVNSHLFINGRIEEGARVSRPSRDSVGYESDTGSRSVELQASFARWHMNGRYERRSDVYTNGGIASPASTFTEHDVSGQVLYRLTSQARVFTNLFLTDRTNRVGGGQSYWQASAGSSFQVGRVSGQAEVFLSRSRDFESDLLSPRSAFTGGLSAQIRKRVSLSLDVYVDRSPIHSTTVSPWMSRTIARVVYTLPTGSAVSPLASVARGPKGGNETIEGIVFVDWNANTVQDPDEETLSGVRVELDRDLGATADKNGRFRFERVASGTHSVSVDLNTVPANFDPPVSPLLELAVRRQTLAKAAFGVLPLGDIEGVLVRDANGSGAVDENDEPLDGAVLVLDDGARTEVTHKGRFRFSGVRLGTHKVELLLESLPDGAALAGQRTVEVQVMRAQMTAKTEFLVKLEKRPEIRKTFVPKKPDPGKPDAKSGGTVANKSGGTTGKAETKTGRPSAVGTRGRVSRGPQAKRQGATR